MGKNDRKRIRTFSSFVNEMQADSVHLSSKMSESVKDSFLLPPVVGVMPVADEFPKVIGIGAQGPIWCAWMVREPCVFQPLAKVT